MAIHLAHAGHYVALRWIGSPTEQDIHQGSAQLEALYLAQGRPLTYIGVIPTMIPFPGPSLRNTAAKSFAANKDRLESIHLLIEGDGIKSGIVRFALAGVIAAGASSVGRKVKVSADAVELLQRLDATPAERLRVQRLLQDLNVASLVG